MSKAKAAAQAKAVGASKAQALELQKRVDELTEALEMLKNENELIKDKFKKLCKKLVENIDMSQYEFIESTTEPDQIDIKDLLNMLQRLALMATQISATDNIETHMEALELRISELTNENSSFFKNKLKLQERLEFIMQERDVWKRNAETLKRMYAKLVKEQKQAALQRSQSANTNKFQIGSHKANIDTANPNQRTFTATIPKDYFEHLRNPNLVANVQLNNLDQKLINHLTELQQNHIQNNNNNNLINNNNNQNNPKLNSPRQTTESDINFFNNDFNNSSLNFTKSELNFLNKDINDSATNSSNSITNNNKATYQNININSNKYNNTNESLVLFPSIDLSSTNNITNNNSYNNNISNNKKPDRFSNNSDLDSLTDRLHTDSNESTNIELIQERPMTTSMTSRKIVSFNKDIDVRIFPKNSKNSKAIESYLLPIAPQAPDSDRKSSLEENIKNNYSQVQNSQYDDYNNQAISNQNQIKSLLAKRNNTNDINSLYALVQNQSSNNNINNSSPNNQINNSQNIKNTTENRFTNRASICSNRKFPGETPVKDLEPTLKMIIIKELSAEKLDGNDWRMFARRIGISDNEINNWTNLKLQYPMARVLSFWSSRPEATTRLLHRHLNASCFNYGALAKRIENFYDVI